MSERTGRAAPMHPDERRDALVGVFLDLAHREGRKPTTSEIAQEAGVAEGTIFRAFPTKEALERDAVESAFCPAPVRRSVAAIGHDLPLRDRLVAFTTILQRRFTDVFGLMAALGLTQPPDRGPHLACFEAGHHLRSAGEAPAPPAVGHHGHHHDHQQGHQHDHQPLFDAVNDLVLEADTEALVVAPSDLLHRLRLLAFSGSHPGIADGRTLTPEEIVDTVLYGVLRREEETA